jgi:hypothetical protein
MSKLEKLQELQQYRLVGGHLRCSICNCVSDESIETELGDYKSRMSFTADPKDNRHFICISCSEAIEEQRREFRERDEWDDLFIDFDN